MQLRRRFPFRTLSIVAAIAGTWGSVPAGHAQWYDQFKDLPSIYARVDQFSADYPSLVENSIIGRSYEGRDIRAFKISGTEGTRAVKPAVLLNSVMHAREWVTPMANMYAAEQLLSQYGNDTQVTALLDHVDVYFVPVLNPDGYEFTWAAPGAVNRLWRKNRKPNADGSIGVDLNRNFDLSWGTAGSSSNPLSETYRGTGPFSEPETRALRDFYHANPNIVSSIDIHAYSQLILGPYGYSATAIADDAEMLDKLGAEMETAILFKNFKTYKYQRASDLYLASGIQSDWAYGAENVYSYTYELRPAGFPGFELPESEILPTAEEVYAGITKLFEFTTAITTGDFNYDGERNCADMDLLTRNFVSNLGPIEHADKFEYDMSGDGALSPDDVFAWLGTSQYGAGDANLDGVVNEADGLILQTNQGLASHSYCSGDLNTDGIVDLVDLDIWRVSVPEPSGVMAFAMGIFGFLSILRRRASSPCSSSNREM